MPVAKHYEQLMLMRDTSSRRARMLMTVMSAAEFAMSVALITPKCGTPPTTRLRIGSNPGEMMAPVAIAGACFDFSLRDAEADL
jgi:hypothetical protein